MALPSTDPYLPLIYIKKYPQISDPPPPPTITSAIELTEWTDH